MCPDCNAARITTGHWPYYCPKCIYCGARLIQRIGKCRVSPESITARRRVVLKDWTAYGHSEDVMRDLVKGPMPVEPVKGK